LCSAATGTVRKVDQNCLERFDMWCCRRIDVISRTDRLNNEEVKQRIADNKNILHTIKRNEFNWKWNQFTKLNQQNAQNVSLDIYVTSH
jgi:hypothetical protein